MFEIIRDTAHSVINQYGKEVIYRKKGTSTYDIATSTSTKTPDTNVNINAVIENYQSNEIGNAVQFGDIKIVIAENNIDFEISSDKVVIDGLEYDIISLSPQYGGEIIITYELQLRR